MFLSFIGYVPLTIICFSKKNTTVDIISWYARRVSGITFIKYAQSQNIWTPNDLKVFQIKKTKEPKQVSQTRQMSHMPERENPYIL